MEKLNSMSPKNELTESTGKDSMSSMPVRFAQYCLQKCPPDTDSLSAKNWLS